MLMTEYDEELVRKYDRMDGIEEGKEIGQKVGMEIGLKVLVQSLKKRCNDFGSLYAEVTSYDEYANVTKDEVLKYYNLNKK